MIPDGLSRDLRPLAIDLATTLRDKPQWAIVKSSKWGQVLHKRPGGLDPFVTTLDGHVLAARFWRRGREAEWWALPTPADRGPWILAAVNHWHEMAPDRFPGRPRWIEDPEWATGGERALTEELELLGAAHDAAEREYEDQRSRILTQLDVARTVAAGRERVPLTAQDDELVAAVEACMSEFAFVIQNLDKAFASGAARREDLRIEVDAHDEWTAIAEVRGYAEGAKTSDLARLGRFANLSTKDFGRAPDRQWYVANQFLGDDTSSRQPPLTGIPHEVAVFAEAGGLLIDTRDLVRLWLAVRMTTIAPADARSSLTEAVGIFLYPAETL